MVVDQEEGGPGASVSTEKVAPVSKRKLTDWPPQLLISSVPQVLLGWELVWGPPGIFSPDCLESPIRETYASGSSLFQCGPLQTGLGAGGGLDA